MTVKMEYEVTVVRRFVLILVITGLFGLNGFAETDPLKALESKVVELQKEIQALKTAREEDKKRSDETSQKVEQLEQDVEDSLDINQYTERLHVGGYGEIHANFEENGKSVLDIHRLVLYLGYDFSDWIQLTSEIELEHAFVADSGDGSNGGEISIEQLYVDFLFSDWFNIRAGRMLAPIGMINQNHEPTKFLGVERPGVDKYIIPSTWSVDGAGIFGYPCSHLSYEAYVVGGLDGSGFTAKDGIRGGRLKERASLNEPAVTGRIDLYPLVECDLPANQDLRLGVSGYYGGTDNGNNGKDPGVDNNFGMVSADFEYDVSRFRFRGVVAQGRNSNAEALVDSKGEQVGSEIFGWYLEGGVSVMPEAWKAGKLKDADLIPFVRYEEYDTQHEVPNGTMKNPAYDRNVLTIGANMPLTREFVLKADYQFIDNKSSSSPANMFNMGMGWTFN